MCSGEVYYLSVEQLKCVVAEGRQEVEDCRNIFVDKVHKALVFLGPGPFLCHFWWCSHVWRNSWRCYYKLSWVSLGIAQSKIFAARWFLDSIKV
jgi:hypothetical protein